MSKRQELKRSIYILLKHSNAGSFSTKATRKEMLLMFADALYAAGIQLTHIQQLKAKHVTQVAKQWIEEGLSAGTLKNRMSNIRFAWGSLNKIEKLPSNDELGIARRTYTPKFNRAPINPDFTEVTNSYARVSLELQRVFGLRREESLKIKPYIADKGDTLQLLPSWCKGNRGRFIPIRTEEQRHWLEEAKKLAHKKDFSFLKEKNLFNNAISMINKCEKLH
jgi:site-specific recombinase XerC